MPKVGRGTVAVVALLTAASARADKEELYTLVGYQGGVSHHQLSSGRTSETTAYAGALDVTAYYGLTNSVHVGCRLRLTRSTDVHFAGATVDVEDGSQATGDVYNDHVGIGLGALVLYRVNTGVALAPLLELEGGVTVHRYRNNMQVRRDASGTLYSVPLADVTDAALHGSTTLLLEYRFRSNWVVVGGIGAQIADGLTPWTLFVPIRVGLVW